MNAINGFPAFCQIFVFGYFYPIYIKVLNWKTKQKSLDCQNSSKIQKKNHRNGETKSIPLTHIYITAHMFGLVHVRQ
jgi:hypothetical protein